MRKFRTLSLLLLLTGCGAPRAYQRAQEADTLEAYRAFLRDYPEADDAEVVAARVEELEFEEASKLHTVVAYKRFLEDVPGGDEGAIGAHAARGAALQRGEGGGHRAALRQFLRDHPDGAHREEAERLLSKRS